MLTSPLEIHHLKLFNFLAGKYVALIYPYSLINLTLMAKKCIFIYENWLVVTIIYQSSQVGNRSGVLVIKGTVEGIWFRKTTKGQKLVELQKMGEWKKHC